MAAWCGWGGANVQAQVDAWAIGNKAVVMPPGTQGATGQPFALPTPNNASYPSTVQYQGQQAQRSQHARTTGDGRLLFFAVDGNLYDGDGYLIADARSANCTECLEPGVMEFVSVPVPGSCGLFYLFSAMPRNGYPGFFGTHVQWSLLDMNADNPRFPSLPPATCARKGRLLQYEELGVSPYQQFNTWLSNDPPAVESSVLPGGVPTSNSVGALIPVGVSPATGTPRIRLVESANANGDHWLFAVIANYIYVYRISATGIYQVDPVGTDPYVRFMPNWNPSNVLEYFHDADAILTALPNRQEDVLALAIAQGYGMYAYPDLTSGKNLIVHYFDRNTGELLVGESKAYAFHAPPAGCPAGITVPLTGGAFVATGLRGCAFRSDGQGLYLTGERTTDCQTAQPYAAHLDLESDAITDLSYAFGPSFDGKWTRSRIYRNKNLVGTGNAVYIPVQGQVGVLQGLENLNAVTFAASAFASVVPPELFNGERPIGCGFTPRFLDIGIAHDRYLSAENRGTCCAFLQTHGSRLVYGHEQAPGMPTSWTNTSNPYGNASPLTCICDIVVKPGASLYPSNLTIKFADEAKVIVERGGWLVGYNSTFTSVTCPAERWEGFQVEGQTHAPNTPSNLQGNLRLDMSLVANAKVGVRTGRFGDPITGPGESGYFGGRVRAMNTIFQDCIIGARIERHHANTSGGGAEQPNQCLFSNCSFVTTPNWPGGQPQYGLYLSDVRHVQVNQCRFENQAGSPFTPDQAGNGILMSGATIRVLGNGNPAQSYVRNLRMGILNVGTPFNPVQVDRMHFENNVYGILDLAGRGVNYSRNTFAVTDQGTAPNPRRGMLLWQSRGLVVEQNTFTGEGRDNSVGIHFVSSVPSVSQVWSYADEKIYNNSFSNLAAGELVKGVHRGNSSGDLEAGLQLLCGDHTNNTFDIALLDQSLLKPNQGGQTIGSGPNAQLQLAGNRFYDEEDCTARFDWAVDANWNVIPGWFPGMQLNYKRHEFPENLVGVTCDEHPEFFDLGIFGSGPFEKDQHCANGVIPINPGSGPVRAAAYALAKSQLVSALDLYNGTVDLGETPDLMEAITKDAPWMPSAQLRDLLLSKHPLSDDAVKAVLLREQPMDAWHLTQVLLQNSPLNRGLWNLAQDEEVLPPFFLNMVAQAQQGQGPSAKQLLEEEIAQRRLEMSGHMNVLIQIYGHDSTSTGSLDSLQRMMLFDKDPQFSVEYLESKMAKGEYTDAAQLLNSEWLQRNGKEVYADLLAMMQETQRQWELLSIADKATLWAHAESTDQGAALAAGILFATTGDAPLPPVAWPDFTKRAGAPAKPRRAAQWNTGNELAAYPNPARDRAYLVYPAALDGGVLNVFDAQGRLVHSMPLRGNGVLELQVAAWTPGLYQVSLAGTPLTTKLIVKP
jgi:hypothetical protein